MEHDTIYDPDWGEDGIIPYVEEPEEKTISEIWTGIKEGGTDPYRINGD